MERRYTTPIKKWLLLTLAIFFVYDIVWMVTSYAEFRQSLNEGLGWVCSDLVFCGMYALVSIAVYSTMFDSKRLMRSRNNNGRHMLLMTGGLILLCNLLVAYGVDLLMSNLASEYYFENAWDRTVMLGLIASVLSMIFMTQYFADRMEQQNRERMELQKKYLKLQLDPHFVFNNLSTLAGMISVEPEKAERYVVLLSHVYRYMLRHIDENISAWKKRCPSFSNLLPIVSKNIARHFKKRWATFSNFMGNEFQFSRLRILLLSATFWRAMPRAA